MKMMNLKYIVGLLLIGILSVSCSLEEDASGFSTTEKFYKDKAQCVAALNSCYIPLKSIYTGTMLIATEGVTDLAYSRSATQDSDLDISPAKPRHGATVWQQGYRGIRYCNAAIAGIEGSPVADDAKAAMLAEGKIMRAFYYWLLTSFFGDVPFYTLDVKDDATLSEVCKLPRMSAVNTRDYLIEELLGFVGEMEQIRANEVGENRVGAAMGWMLIAKMAAWNKQWETVLEAGKALEAIYGELSQYPLEDIPFSKKNTAESIFEIQHTYVAGGIDYTSTVASMCMPYPREGSKYAGVEIPELGSNATSYAPMMMNTYMVNNLLAKETGDKRRAMSFVSEWNGMAMSGSGIGTTTAFFGPKFWCYGMQTNHDSNNYKVFRYADALLLMAEAHCMLRDDMDTAITYLNKTRARAGIKDFARRSWPAILEGIQEERARELFGEFQRKFDLVRWGTWYKRTLDNTRKNNVRNNILPCHEYYPIPDTQVAYSGYALDNKAYNAYGL